MVPSRDSVQLYKLLKDEIDRLVGQVNAEYSTSYWSPIHYFYDSYPIEKLCALYSAADVCLVTPIRDGMNLVSKEFIACNSSEDSTGVLILSEMAGASKELKDTFIINPTNIEEMTETLHKALQLPEETQKKILRNLYKHIKKNDIYHWVNLFMNSFKKVVVKKRLSIKKSIPKNIDSNYLSIYHNSKKRLLLIDYDGTMVPFTKQPEDAVPSKKTLRLLNLLQEQPENEVFLISGRKRKELYQWHKDGNYNLLAEHGAWKLNKLGVWKKQATLNTDWKGAIRNLMHKAKNNVPGSFIEEKDFSLVWHYRAAEPKKAEQTIASLENETSKLKEMDQYDLEILDGNKVWEVKCKRIDKGKAAQMLIHQIIPDFILAMGDDHTDEDMFEVLPKSAYSIKIGKNPSAAQYFLPDQAQVFDFLSSFLIKPKKKQHCINKTENKRLL